jgi:acyl dehydratase
MPSRVLERLSDLRPLVGQELGVSDWLPITQDRVRQFAEATGDWQWIHCDPQRAARESPYGGAIAHGFLTMSLGPALMQQLLAIGDVRLAVNYGTNRVRFPNCVRVGGRLRLRLLLQSVEGIAGGVQATFRQTFEVEGETKPACVAESVLRFYT